MKLQLLFVIDTSEICERFWYYVLYIIVYSMSPGWNLRPLASILVDSGNWLLVVIACLKKSELFSHFYLNIHVCCYENGKCCLLLYTLLLSCVKLVLESRDSTSLLGVLIAKNVDKLFWQMTRINDALCDLCSIFPRWWGLEYANCIPCRELRSPSHRKGGVLGMTLNCICWLGTI